MEKVRLKLLPCYQDYFESSEKPTDPIRFYYLPLVGKLYRKRVELCLSELKNGRRILEVGFGSGVTFLNLMGRFEEIWGIDSDADCQEVKHCLGGMVPSLNLKNGSILATGYPDAFFDSVLLISILEHLRPPDLDTCFQEIRRILKPGGQLVYGVPVERPLMVFAFIILGYDIRKLHFSTEKKIFQEASRYFTQERVRHIPFPGKILGNMYEVVQFRKLSIP